MIRPTRSKLNERRRQVALYALGGWTQSDIARHMNIPAATVSRDLTALEEPCREFPIADIEKARIQQLQKLDLVETEAWAAWERSKELQYATEFSGGEAGSKVRIKPGVGDPRYLTMVLRCIARRCILIGMNPVETPASEFNIPFKVEQPEPADQDCIALREVSGELRSSPAELQRSERIPATLT